jgi:hypothetical protein
MLFRFFRAVFLLLALAYLAASVFMHSRRQAMRSRGRKRCVAVRGSIAMALGVWLALWLPDHSGGNRESPGLLFVYLLYWILGGGLVLLGLASLAGAWMAPPAPARDVDSDA